MSQAPKYIIQTAFATDESNQAAGRSTVRTAQIDIEHANVATSINAVIDNLNFIQRDDGKLKDNIVELSSLSSQIRILLASKGNIRGQWFINTNYAIGDIAQYASIVYIALFDHNSGSVFSYPLWIALTDSGSAATSASLSALSALAALNSQNLATTQVGLSTTQASNANTSASAAATSAANAANSALAALTSIVGSIVGASQSEAVAGIDNSKYMSSLRVAQALGANAKGVEYVVATGTSSIYSIAPTSVITAYKEGLAWDVKFPVACLDSPVASISGLANTNIVILATDGTYQNCAARDIIVGSLSTLQLIDAGGGALKLWLKDPAVEHTRLSVITVDTALNIPNSLGKVIKSGGGASRILTLPVFSTFPLEGVIEIISENATNLKLVRQAAGDVIDFYGTNPATNPVTGAFLDVPFQTALRIIRNNTSWQITNSTGAAAISKIQSISASVAANALTLTYNGGSLDFRSASLTEGATAPLTVSANSIVVPSGATLGMLSAIQSRLILLEAYNGGSPVACVVNLTGNLQLDETNLISPTTISAAATSASVIYSASAVSANSPYRVVGFVDITETTAGTWATDATLKQGAGGQVLAGVLKSFYESPQQIITIGGGLTLLHGLSKKPTLIKFVLQCVTAEMGFAAGDEITEILSGWNVGARGVQIVPSLSSLTLRYGNDAAFTFVVLSSSTGAAANLTNANWRLVVRAWA